MLWFANDTERKRKLPNETVERNRKHVTSELTLQRHQCDLCTDDIMKPLSVINEMHATKRLWQSNKSRESLLRAVDKAIDKDVAASSRVVASVCGCPVALLPLLLDACCLLGTVWRSLILIRDLGNLGLDRQDVRRK